MWWHLFLFTLFTIFCINYGALCDQSKLNALTTIRNIILDESERLQNLGNNDYCFSYGEQKRYQDGETKSRRLLLHDVCFEDDSDLKKTFVEAIVRKRDMGENKGEKPKDKAKHWLKNTYDSCKCDEAGHIIPRNFGGSGYLYNLFAQNSNVNRGIWNTICKRISDFFDEVNTPDQSYVRMQIYFIYEDAAFPYRPSGFYYTFIYNDGQFNVKEESGYLANENHDGINMAECDVQGYVHTRILLYMSSLSTSNVARQTCSAVHENEKYEYGPKLNQGLTTLLSDGIKFFK